MEKIKAKEILEATGGRLIQGNENTCFSSISTDTRTLKRGDLFVALKGKNFNAHDFITQAVKKGAKGIIKSSKLKAQSSKLKTCKNLVVIEVRDTLRALQDAANFYRRKFNIPLIAVSGSNGKTTTKEMLWNILSRRAPTLKNKGNYNNEVGVPLTLFELKKCYKFAVLELGTNAPGEIKRLAEIAEPTVGIVTNVSLAHTEGLSDINGVAKEKLSLFTGLRKGGIAILNNDDKILRKALPGLKKQGLLRITCGVINRLEDCRIKDWSPLRRWRTSPISSGGKIKKKPDVCATEIDDLKEKGMKFTMRLPGRRNAESRKQSIALRIPLAGMHNVYNALAAAAAARALGVSSRIIKDGLENIKTLPMRMEIKKLRGTVIINDAYNANPHSVEEAVSIIEKWVLPSGRKILILGDMLELGRWSVAMHEKLAGVAMKRGVDVLFTLGKMAGITARHFKKKGGAAFIYNNRDKIAESVLKQMRKGDLILIKGSRAMKMEEVAEKIESRIQNVECSKKK